MSNELVTIEESTALQVFSADKGLEPIIQQARDAVEGFDHDLSTGAGRKRTASLANKVAKLKTRLDGMGKDLVADWKTKAKAVDANRKAMRDELDELKIVARKPLTEWETEQAEIEAAETARLEAEKIAQEIEQGHEVALLLNEKFDRELAEKLAEEKRLEEERQRIEAENKKAYEDELMRIAAEQARLEAERVAEEKQDRIEAEKQEAINRELEATRKAEQAERDRIAAIERAKVEAEQAEIRRVNQEKQAAQDKADAELREKQAAESAEQYRIESEQRAEQQRIDNENNTRIAAERAEQYRLEAIEQSRLSEIKRQQDEEEARIAQQAKLEANRKHSEKIHTAMKDAFIAAGLDEDSAIKAVKALVSKSIPNIGAVQY